MTLMLLAAVAANSILLNILLTADAAALSVAVVPALLLVLDQRVSTILVAGVVLVAVPFSPLLTAVGAESTGEHHPGG